MYMILNGSNNFIMKSWDYLLSISIQGSIFFLDLEVPFCYASTRTTQRQRLRPPAHFGGGKQHVAFEVSKSDYGAAKAEIKSKGIVIIDEVIWKSGEESFYFEDPEGNVLEIVPDKGIWD